MSRSDLHDARNAALRQRTASCDGARALGRPTAETAKEQAEALHLPHHLEVIPDSQETKIHWLGDRSAKRAILYFHGGGYGLPLYEGHVIFLAQCIKKLAERGEKTVIALLEYGQTKVKKYPVQFLQATEGLRAVLSAGYKPSDIIVGGDSCGANMALALMSILLHPHEGIKPLKLESPLAGLLLISAWVSFKSDSQSFKDNNERDIHQKAQMHEWADDFATPEERNNYTEPVDADSSWFKGFPARKTLNIYGGYEIFRDDIAAVGKKLREAGAVVDDVECPLQVHIDCILDAAAGYEVGPMSTETWKWLENVF